MTDVITGPGFQASTAGKCQALYVGECPHVFGYTPAGYTAVWLKSTGECIYGTGVNVRLSDLQITGPWIDPPPARHECWVNVYEAREPAYHDNLENAEKCAMPDRIGPARHMVELREGEVIVPREPTLEMRNAGAAVPDWTPPDIYRAMIAARPK